MGMGDKKPPYRPSYGKERDDVTGRMFSTSLVRPCLEPSVVRRYGKNGEANVCIWVCSRCKHAKRYPFHGGLGCELDGNI